MAAAVTSGSEGKGLGQGKFGGDAQGTREGGRREAVRGHTVQDERFSKVVGRAA